MRLARIVNDPVHGFIRLPEGRVMQALEQPSMQRLRRLSQLGLAQLVYPGATHTRFNHALGVLHLAQEALTTLQTKGLTLPPETQEATLLAALLHDLGHGPFSHTLEGLILPLSHEQIGHLLLERLEKDLGSLEEVRALWQGTHPQAFLCELIAGPLDVDRLDYLTRDSFFTGVQEGMVGTERLVYTMAVADGRLVVEEKGLNSVEKFIVTRRFMYWQVYLHKTVLSAEQLLRRWWHAWQHHTGGSPVSTIEDFLKLDEMWVWSRIHQGAESAFPPLRALSRALLWRVLYKLRFVSPQEATSMREAWEASLPAEARPWKAWFWAEGQAENIAYWPEGSSDIPILGKDGKVRPLSEVASWLKGLAGPTKRFFAGGIPAASLESLLR